MSASIPRDRAFDSSPALARDGYEFIGKRCRRYRSEAVEARLLGRRVICFAGPDAAAAFYDEERFERAGVIPPRIEATLLGRGGVHGLDGQRHLARKAMFMSFMTRRSIERFGDLVAKELGARAERWERGDGFVLFDELEQVLCRAACEWAGVPLEDEELPARARDLGAMTDAFGAVGPRYWRGRGARHRTEKWLVEIVERIWKRRITTFDGTAADIVPWHRGPAGALLSPHLVAVELIDVLRPIVALATYVTFAATALHEHPSCRAPLLTGGEEEVDFFVQEVRRFYPFVPFLAARTRVELEWKGFTFPKGRLVLLDVYGHHHDARTWERPDEFLPERFRGKKLGPFDLIPQGGGDHFTGHRCAGEWLTIEALKVAVTFLTKRIAYDVPRQDLAFDLARIPSRPRSGFVLANVRRIEERTPGPTRELGFRP